MRVVVTRPQADSERTAAALEALGHEVLVTPLMRIEPVAADLAGTWSAIVITSANALQAVPVTAAKTLPVFAVGDRSAEAARQAGFAEVSSANGDIKDLVRLVAARAVGARRATSASTIMPISCSNVTDGVHPRRWRPFDASPIR